MSYSILRVEKVKGSNNTRGLQKHNQRENKNYSNPDINQAESYKNYDLINDKNIDYQQMIDERIEANYTGKRKIRSDAIRHVDGIITSDEVFFKKQSDDEVKTFFRESLNFLEKEYGKENMLYATVHMDEKTPHMHFGFVPLTEDGRLSAKEKLGNKKVMTNLQDRFNDFVNERGYELKRGLSRGRTGSEHKTVEEYKSETQYYEKETERAKQESERMKAEQQQAEKAFEKMKMQLQKDINRFNQPPNFKVEDEFHTERNIFGKVTSSERTGRVIMTDADFDTVKQRFFSATRILDDYETLRNQDIHKENQFLKKDKADIEDTMLIWKEEYQKSRREVKQLKHENETLKEENKELHDFSDTMIKSTTGLYKAGRRHIKDFERAYNRFADALAEKERTEPLSRFMKDIQGVVHEQDHKKSRRNDLEL